MGFEGSVLAGVGEEARVLNRLCFLKHELSVPLQKGVVVRCHPAQTQVRVEPQLFYSVVAKYGREQPNAVVGETEQPAIEEGIQVRA